MELWLTMFLLGAAHDVDARTGTMHALALREQVWEQRPVIALEWAIAELSNQVSQMLA